MIAARDMLAQRLGDLSASVLEIADDSAEHAGHAGAAGGGGHFSLTIVSEQFCGPDPPRPPPGGPRPRRRPDPKPGACAGHPGVRA